MPVCPHCGHDTQDTDARFCAACGRPLANESAGETTSVLHLGAGAAEGPLVAVHAISEQRINPVMNGAARMCASPAQDVRSPSSVGGPVA